MASYAKNGPHVNCCSLPPSHTWFRIGVSKLTGKELLQLAWPSSEQGEAVHVTASVTQLSSQSHSTSAGLLMFCHPNRSDPSPHSLSGMGHGAAGWPLDTLPPELMSNSREVSTLSVRIPFMSCGPYTTIPFLPPRLSPWPWRPSH